jgi:hypothetical protein
MAALPKLVLTIVVVLLLTTTMTISVDGIKILFETTKNGGPVVCSDSIDNICTASTDCGVIGNKEFNAGQNFQFEPVKTDNGNYIIQGGYSISFSVACNITCIGNCTCTTCSRQTQITDDNSKNNNNIPSASAGNTGNGVKSNSTSSATSYSTVINFMSIVGVFFMSCGLL